MEQDNKVVSFSGKKLLSRFNLPPALVRLRDTSGKSLKHVLERVFERTDDALFELADRAGSNKDQTAYFDAMRELRLQRKPMVLSVSHYVGQAFNTIGKFQPRQAGTVLDEFDQDSLSLVEHADLEQQVAVENLITKLRNRYQNSIQLLSLRVSYLVPGVELADSQMPLSPEVICGGVAQACAELDIDIRAKLVVLKLFDQLLAGTLGDFYHDANRTLIAEGVLPDLKRPPKPATSGAAGGSQGGISYATFSELSSLLHQQGIPRAAAEPSASRDAYLDTDQLMARLGKVQASFGLGESEEVISLDQQLQPVFQAANGKKASVGQVDSDVINLVSMLFDFILEERQLHPIMKALISRLQIPVLKVALSDNSFFNRGGHPVRRLLNELALAAIGWSEKRPDQRDPLREKIELIVTRVLNEYSLDVALFDELLEDFRHFADLDRRRRELVEQRLRDAEEGRARQERASQVVESLVAGLTSGRDVPEPVLEILDNAWAKYLQWAFLREGEDGERWSDARELSGHLVWSVDPQPITDGTRSELLKAMPGIVDNFRAALQEISWDPFATDAAVRDLELAHEDVFQHLTTSPSAPVGVVADDEPATPAVSEAVEEVVTQEYVELVSQHWLEQVDSLRVGAWIELTRGETKLRCKLAALIRATGKYIFVNRSGAKVAEYYREDLAAVMASGAVSMLDDGLIFDRALESIIDNLRSNRKD